MNQSILGATRTRYQSPVPLDTRQTSRIKMSSGFGNGENDQDNQTYETGKIMENR
jgi:hypothetical protein